MLKKAEFLLCFYYDDDNIHRIIHVIYIWCFVNYYFSNAKTKLALYTVKIFIYLTLKYVKI